MKRGRWWLGGTALAVLAGCVFAWKWAERPPYEFMEGGRLWFVWSGEVYSPGSKPDFRTLYALRSPGAQSVARAKAELGSWDLKVSNERGAMFTKDRVIVAITSDPEAMATFPCPPVPPGTTAVVVISREPTLLDQVRGWLYGLRWRESRPSSDVTGAF